MLTEQQRDLFRDAVHLALHEFFIADSRPFSFSRVRDIIKNRNYLDDVALLEDDEIQVVIEAAVEREAARLTANGAVPRFEEVEPVANRRQWAGGSGVDGG